MAQPLVLGPQFPKHLGPDLGSLDIRTVAVSVFLLIVFLVVLYTLIAVYHWMRYGHRSVLAIPAIAVHIFVSLALIAFAATGLP